MSTFLLIYLLLCLAVAVLGRDTLVGPIGIFVVSLIFTPVLVLFFLALFGPRHPGGPPARYIGPPERHVRYSEDDRKPGCRS